MADTSRKAELSAALKTKVAANQELADSIEVKGDTVILTDDHRTEFNKNMTDIKDIRGLISDMDTMSEAGRYDPDAAEKAHVAQQESVAAELAAKTAAIEELNEVLPQFGTLGEAFIKSDEFKSLAGGANGLTMAKHFESGGVSTKDVYSALPSGTPGAFGTVQRDPIVQIPQRTSRVRDLFPTRTTTAAVIEYFRVNGYLPAAGGYANAASTVAERDGASFGAKPQTSLTFIGEQAPVRTIAHWEAAHRNVLSDEPQLASIIDNELLYGLRLHEDFQILQGAGTGDDLTGILSNVGAASTVQTYSWSAGSSTPVADNKADAIRRALTLSFLSYYEPTGVVVHPSDWEDIELTKDSQGQYLMAVNIQQGAQARVWRIPVVDTPAMPAGRALVGAFGTGAQLYDREAPTIRVAEQHADFFVRNAIVVLAEQRLALAIKRPEAFVDITFDAEPS